MGGKTKHVQRTKNNTKPSSSGRSAELLASSNIPSTVGFANVTEFGFLPTMLQGFSVADNSIMIDDMDSTIDTNYQLVFRKMMKKDSITKVKALQEFNELVVKTESATVKAILPFWPRLYNNLSTDVEHRVREAAQQAQLALVSQVGKSIAPYLKQIAPAWITSQYDTYAPAASIATTSFQKAFPSHKLQDVFNFCQNEVLDYITKNLTFYTATTLSNPQSNTPEECEAKYQRVLICSLKGYALYLAKISSEHLNEASNKNTALIENSKFWSYQKHKNPIVRAAWFEALSALLQFTPELLTNFEKQTATSALQNLDETETVALPHVWASILLVTQKIANWQTYINMEKALLPKLWKILKNGGGGSAETIYPHLLPFLSKLDVSVLGDKIIPFYLNFFENINAGLRSRVLHQASSRADITAIATAYYECIQFVFIQLRNGSTDAFGSEFNLTEFCLTVLREHLIGVIAFFLENGNNAFNGKCVLGRLIVLVQFWSNTCGDNELYKTVLDCFWSELFGVIEKSFAKEKNDQQTAANLNLIFDFVQLARNQSMNVKPKSAKVKFNIEAEQQSDQIDGVAEIVSPTKIGHCETELNQLVANLCKLYMTKISITMNSVFVEHLENLFKQFGNEAFFKKISTSSNDITKLYDKFASWLLIPQLRSENIVDIVLMLYPHLQVSEKSKLLNKLVKFPNEIVQNWVLSRILSHPLCIEADIIQLLSQPIVTELLTKSAQAVINGNATDNINLLHKCFFQNEIGDILIDRKTCEAIFEILSEPLDDATADSSTLDTCASFLAQILPAICSDEKKKDLQINLFVKLFRLSVNKEISSNLSEDTLWEVMTSWQDALSSNDIQLNESLLDVCSTVINKNLLVAISDQDVAVESLENISEIVSKLILCSIECYEEEDAAKYQCADNIIKNIFKKCNEAYELHLDVATQSCTFVELINGKQNSSAVDNLNSEIFSVNTYESVSALFKLAVFKFLAIFKITCNVKKRQKSNDTEPNDVSNESTNTDDEHTEDFCDLDETLIKQWSNQVYEETLNGIYVATLAQFLLDNFTLSGNITTIALNLQEKVRLFLQNIPANHVATLKELLFNCNRFDDPIWALSTHVLLNVEPYNNAANGYALLHNDLIMALNGTEHLVRYINVLQSFTPKLVARQLSISANIFNNTTELHYKSIGLKCLLNNYFQSETNEIGDHEIVAECTKLIDELYSQSKIKKDLLLYNENLSTVDGEKILQTTEIVQFLTDILKISPLNITANGWDFIRIAISSWVLSLSKSSDSWKNPKIAIFIASVYKMFSTFYDFINAERIKSSSRILSQVIDEWEHVFAKDVNLILLKCFMKFVQQGDNTISVDDNRKEYFLKTLSQCIDNIDFKHVHVAHKIDSKTSIDDLIQFALKNLCHKYHTVRISCATIIKKMSAYLIEKDVERLGQRSEPEKTTDGESSSLADWHYLHKFDQSLKNQNDWCQQYIKEFSFKSTELDEFSEIPTEQSLPFLLLWDCILHVCDKATSELRSIYAAFLVEQKYDQTLLNLLFRLMPSEVLRNQESKAIGSVYFASLPWLSIASDAITSERYACYVYTLALKHLPAVVRKWWTNSHPRQKSLVDKITTAFVSNQLCTDELRALLDKKEKHNSFQISVHTSTREVHATYVIDEARLELVIQLPLNYPLGTVKVSCGQQIGDKLQSRVVVMQLSIFLTHQNGSIWDGLSLWKCNWDRKFEGVEECYVCYSVIHQETCQLPKLTCKTCKKKFHGQCLYKWFSTSNKSTCPICRNVF